MNGLDLRFDSSCYRRKSYVSSVITQLGNPDDPEGVKKCIQNPVDVKFITRDYFIVADLEKHRLLIFGLDGRLAAIIGDQEVWPSTIAVTPDRKVVVSNTKNRQIELYDVGTGKRLYSFGQDYHGYDDEIEEKPHGVAVNSKGQIFVSDMVLHTITIYSSEGKLLKRMGSYGTHLQQYNLPFYIHCDQNDNLLIADNMNYCVKVLDPKRNFMYKIGSGIEWGKRQLLCPYGVTGTNQGGVIVADWGAERPGKVGFYHPDLPDQGLSTVVGEQIGVRNPTGVALNDCGQLVVTENNQSYAGVKIFQTVL